MNFSEYRSKALKALWSEVEIIHRCNQIPIINHPEFSTHQIDNICAIHWKFDCYGNKLQICVEGLLMYIEKLLNPNKN
jgi:hypothetical protein